MLTNDSPDSHAGAQLDFDQNFGFCRYRAAGTHTPSAEINSTPDTSVPTAIDCNPARPLGMARNSSRYWLFNAVWIRSRKGRKLTGACKPKKNDSAPLSSESRAMPFCPLVASKKFRRREPTPGVYKV